MLTDLVKSKLSSIISNIKSITELNGWTDSNLIDTMSAITYYEATSKQNLMQHLQNPPFSKELKLDEELTASLNKQHDKLDQYIWRNYHKIEFED